LLTDPFECLLRDDLPHFQRQCIELELTATARIGPRRPGESAEAYAFRNEAAMRSLVEQPAMKGLEGQNDRPSFGDEDEDASEDATPPSAEWVSTSREARHALATYCHTHSPAELQSFNKHVTVMYDLDPSRTIHEVRRMVDEFRPEWDPRNPVRPDLFRHKR
jgi:hypothetical protein